MKKFLSLLVLALICFDAIAQSVTLTFTGRDAKNQYVKLDRVVITNLTQNWQETIYYPDTILMMGETGVDDFEIAKEFKLSQNVPNPFEGATDFELQMVENGNVAFEITDINGRSIVGANNYSPLQAGTHHFRATLAIAGTYLLTARCGNHVATVKMVNNGCAGENVIQYLGEGKFYPLTATLKGGKGSTTHPFVLGDNMKYVGYATINGKEYASLSIEQNQTVSEEVVFSFDAAPYTLPTVMTTEVSNITANSAVCGGNVTEDGGSEVTARGVCWGTSPEPTGDEGHTSDSLGIGEFTSTITGLTANTTYYVRAYAINSEGTAYGTEKSFTTLGDIPSCATTPTVIDYDNNVYNTVQIGSQCWMKENLRTTTYADGTSIEQGSTSSRDVAYWYYPNNDTLNKATYGLLYNWKAVMRNSSSSSVNPSNVQGICPNGWHVPSDAEWTQLTDYVSSQSQYVCGSDNTYVAKALASTTGWKSSTNTCAVGNTQSNNNATGFGALPAGTYRGRYYFFGEGVNYWSATESNRLYAYFRGFGNYYAFVGRDVNDKYYGCSVRCLRDN